MNVSRRLPTSPDVPRERARSVQSVVKRADVSADIAVDGFLIEWRKIDGGDSNWQSVID